MAPTTDFYREKELNQRGVRYWFSSRRRVAVLNHRAVDRDRLIYSLIHGRMDITRSPDNTCYFLGGWKLLLEQKLLDCNQFVYMFIAIHQYRKSSKCSCIYVICPENYRLNTSYTRLITHESPQGRAGLTLTMEVSSSSCLSVVTVLCKT